MNSNHDHAYLILAHKDDYTFRSLLKLIDDQRNTIFIHMDCKNSTYNPEEVIKYVRTKVIHVKRLNVKWGGYSLIKAELMLLQTAVKYKHFQYYHLLSAEDLPIKSQDEIHSFFDDASKKQYEFVHFDSNDGEKYRDRIYYYYLYTDLVGRNRNIVSKILRNLQFILLNVQKRLKVKRNIDFQIMKGAEWFSITNEFAEYIIERKTWIKKKFNYTFCGDEIFIQTILFNSPFVDKLYQASFDNSYRQIVRYIDWERGGPYVFREEDFNQLINYNDAMFARKFQYAVDSKIIDNLREKLIQ